MSKIWDSLKMVEQATNGSSRQDLGSVPERRCGPRLWFYTRVLVYGRTASNEPFHEPTEALRVNAAGGLITLTTTVELFQTIVLLNRINQKEQKSRVVGFRGTYLGRSPVGLEFLEPFCDFWNAE